MKVISLVPVVLWLVTVPAPAAEPGRQAEIHLRDGTVVRCVVLGYAEDEFRIEESGEEYSVPIGTVAKVVFGKAVGEFVRNPFEPPKPDEPTTAPASRKPREALRRTLEKLIASLDLRGLVVRLGRWTGRFNDPDLLRRTQAGIKRVLADRPQKGDLDKNLKLALAILTVAQNEMRPAKDILDDLKKDYPDDRVIQDLKPVGLRWAIERVRNPRRPGRRRSPPRGKERPDPERPPPE